MGVVEREMFGPFNEARCSAEEGVRDCTEYIIFLEAELNKTRARLQVCEA